MTGIVTLAGLELRVASRNLWIVIAVVLTILFAVVLAGVGDSTTERLDADRLGVTVAGLTTLSVYLVPLIALVLGFDAVAGERERGTLALLFTYPTGRGEILLGKLLAHLLVLTLSIGCGYAAAAIVAGVSGGTSAESLSALARLFVSAVVLGATFLAIGYLISAMTRSVSAAAGIAIGVWIVAVVLYDLALLGALVYDDGGVFTKQAFPWLLMANPADAFRTFNLLVGGLLETAPSASGLVGTPDSTPAWMAATSLLLWPAVAMTGAWRALSGSAP